MHQRLKQSPLAIGVLTGVTALVGGIEPAAAATDTQNDTFTQITADSRNTGETALSGNGTFSDTASAPTSFDLFNPSLGNLTGVTVTVTSTFTDVLAEVNGNCLGEGTISCGASATNDSTFSVVLDVSGGPISFPVSGGLFSITADASCSSSITCAYFNEESTLGPAGFNFVADQAQLSMFVAGSPGEMFDVTPMISLAGPYSWTSSGAVAGSVMQHNSNQIAQTTWGGTIDVTYTFEVPNGVPEPANLFLVGAGLAGLGFARRKRQHV